MNKTKTGTLAALLIIGLVINSVPLLVSVAAATDGWTLIHDARSMKAYPDLKEYVWQKNASMPPNGPYDMIRLHRLVKTGVQTRGVVFFDPGTEGGQFLSNPPTDNFTKDENCSIAIYFANRGFDVYALDQRSAFIQNLNVSQMGQIMKDWGFDQRMGDTKEAIDKAKEVSSAKKIFFVGQIGGGLVAVNYAAKYWKEDLRGIILIEPQLLGRGDPVLEKRSGQTNTYNLTKAINDMIAAGNAAMDTLPIQPRWQYIFANPSAPAEYPPGTPLTPTINPATNKTWANITEWAAYSIYMQTTPPGAGSNALGGYGNITLITWFFSGINRYGSRRVVLLEPAAIADWTNCPYLTYDFDDHWTEIGVPLITFNSELYSNSTGTFRFVSGINNTDFTAKIFPNYGRYDLALGQYAARDVFEPAYQWMMNHLTVEEKGDLQGFYRNWKVMLCDGRIYIFPPQNVTGVSTCQQIGAWDPEYYGKLGKTALDAAKPAIDECIANCR